MTDALPLRLGVWCALLGEGGLLLSKRSDLNVWALPGGRLDVGETLSEAAAREAEEETGIQAAALRPVGLYYMAGWRRLNVLFRGEAAGGDLRGRTGETRDNRFFPLDSLPPMPLAAPVSDIAADRYGQTRIIANSRLGHWQLRARFGLRYVSNALHGRPEPAYPVFNVSTAAVVTSADGSRQLTARGPETAAGQLRALPRMDLGGDSTPWASLAAFLDRQYGVRGPLRWAGIWQDTAGGAVEFVFSARADGHTPGEWTAARTAALDGCDAAILARMADSAPWLIEAQTGASHAQPLAAVR